VHSVSHTEFALDQETGATYWCNILVQQVRYIAHPCYTPSNDQDHDDIALIQLSEPVTVSFDIYHI